MAYCILYIEFDGHLIEQLQIENLNEIDSPSIDITFN